MELTKVRERVSECGRSAKQKSREKMLKPVGKECDSPSLTTASRRLKWIPIPGCDNRSFSYYTGESLRGGDQPSHGRARFLNRLCPRVKQKRNSFLEKP